MSDPNTTTMAVAHAARTPRPAREQLVAEARERNALTTAIRGATWSKEANEITIRAIAEYCWRNKLDPVRHVELLGGKIYLTATLYLEKAAPYVRAGIYVPSEPDLIHADERLDALAASGDAWGREEQCRRMRLRIMHGVPESATGACVYSVTVAKSGAVFTGVNWCGGGTRVIEKAVWENNKRTDRKESKDGDPIGTAEPVKTAITRAQRRAWVALIQGGGAVDFSLESDFKTLEARAEHSAADIVEQTIARAVPAPSALVRLAVPADGEYGSGTSVPPERAHDADTPAPIDAELAEHRAPHGGDAEALGVLYDEQPVVR